MKGKSVTLWEVEPEEIAALPDGFPVLQFDTLYTRYEIKHKGKNKFPTARRFVYLLFDLPDGWIV